MFTKHTIGRAVYVAIIVMFALSLFTSASAAGDTWIVNPALADDSGCVAPTRQCKTIQAAITAAADGDTIKILAGNYDTTLDIDTRSNLTLQGAGQASTLIKPSTLLDWNVGGYGSTRKTAIRIVGSTGITISGITLDMDLVKANSVFGLLAYNSSGTLSRSILKNNQVSDAAGGYYEIGVHVRAVDAPYDSTNRAVFNFTEDIFQDAGRVAINTHNWTQINISNSTFLKTQADFGYGIEIGSTSTANITGNVFHGFNTPAASDNSSSSAIYIENCFTGSITSAVAKNVTIAFNEIYDNQVGVHIGNEFDTLAGNVDINVTLTSNNIHNNTDAGVWVADEDASAGSSVTLTAQNNTVTNSGTGYGFWTKGDGQITANLSGETITGNILYDGILAGYDTSIGNSVYDISVTNSNISGNVNHGINSYSGITINAPNNWWGSSAGPGVGGNNGTTGSVDTGVFAKALVTGPTGSTHEVGETGTLNTNVTADGLYGVQFVVNHDPTILSFSSGISQTLETLGWYWDFVPWNFDKTITGKTRLGSSMQQRPSGANLTGQSMAQWTYKCDAVGSSALTYDTTTGSGTYLSDKDGFKIPSALTGGVITCKAKTAASVDGYIKLQGRLGTDAAPKGWYNATVTLTCVSGDCLGLDPYTMVTDDTGHYQLLKTGPGSGVVLGTYSVSVTRRAYLGATKATDVTITDSGNTINDQSSAPTLLGGDVTGDGQVLIGDMSAIGGHFGESITPDTEADINGDGFINIFDLAMAGGNYNLSTSTWTP